MEQDAVRKKYGIKIYIPLIVLVALMVVFKVLKLGEDIGMPLMFLLSAVTGMFTGKKSTCSGLSPPPSAPPPLSWAS